LFKLNFKPFSFFNPAFPSVLAFLLSVGLHAFFEGFTLGAQISVPALWTLAATMAAHKWILSLALVAMMAEKNIKARAASANLQGVFFQIKYIYF
jgi:hypothetical protein